MTWERDRPVDTINQTCRMRLRSRRDTTGGRLDGAQTQTAFKPATLPIRKLAPTFPQNPQ